MKILDMEKENIYKKQYTLELSGRELTLITASLGLTTSTAIEAFYERHAVKVELQKFEESSLYESLLLASKNIGLMEE